MKVRAAVVFEAKRPLEIVVIDLEGPKASEFLAGTIATGICHTDACTLNGFDSERIFFLSLAMKAQASCAKWAKAGQSALSWCSENCGTGFLTGRSVYV